MRRCRSPSCSSTSRLVGCRHSADTSDSSMTSMAARRRLDEVARSQLATSPAARLRSTDVAALCHHDAGRPAAACMHGDPLADRRSASIGHRSSRPDVRITVVDVGDSVGRRDWSPRSGRHAPSDRRSMHVLQRGTCQCSGIDDASQSRATSSSTTEPSDGRVQSPSTLLEQLDHAALLGDEGVDAGGLGVEVVGDRPLSVERRDGNRSDRTARASRWP